MLQLIFFNLPELLYRTDLIFFSFDIDPNDYNYCEENRTRLNKFLDIICGKKKPIYSLHFKTTYHHSLSDKKIRGIVNSCSNIIHLDFESSSGFSDEALITIAELYTQFMGWSMKPCHNLKELYFAEAYWITDKSTSCIMNLCPKLRCLEIAYSHGEINIAKMSMQTCYNIEYPNLAYILAIVRSCPNLKHFNISHNDIDDEVIEAVACTCYKLEYLDLRGCEFITEPLICNVIRSCPKLKHLKLGFCNISNETIGKIAHSCSNLKYRDLESCENISKKFINELNLNIHIMNFEESYEWSGL
nr:12441_t:CDS:2 [Entrophospora candida]